MNRIDVPSKTTFSAEFYGPPAPTAAGLVVLVYGTDGFVDNERGPWRTMVRGYAEDLASRGVCALIPDYFQSTGTQHGGAAAFEIGSRRGEWAAALVDTVNHARTLAGVDPARIGMLGFSLGGYLALLTRAAVKPRALVEYFAPSFDGIGAAGSVPSAQIHHGTNDHGPTAFANAASIAATLKGEQTKVEVFEYKDATHGFATASAADTKAATDSKATTLKFFETFL